MIDTWKSYTKKITFFGEGRKGEDLDIYMTVCVNIFDYPKRIEITVGKEGGVFSVYNILCQFINLALANGFPVCDVAQILIGTSYRPQNLPFMKSITDVMAKYLKEFPKYPIRIVPLRQQLKPLVYTKKF